MTTATLQDFAAYIMKKSDGAPTEDFKKLCKNPEFMKQFVQTIRRRLESGDFCTMFVIETNKNLIVDSVDRWATEIANIILGNSPSQNRSPEK